MAKQTTKHQQQTPSTNERLTKTVSFRLDLYNYSLLQQRAAADKTKLGPWVGSEILHILAQEESEGNTPERLAVLENEVSVLRQQLRLGIEAILLAIVTGKRMTIQDTKEWVAANLGAEHQ